MENTIGNGREQARSREIVSLSEKPTHLDLFSGIGGFAKAAREAGFRTIGFCEIDKYCRKVLAKNFDLGGHAEGNTGSSFSSISQGPNTITRRIYPNIFTLDGRDFAGVSLITGGFPCQPFSVAGKRRGAADDRAIWPEMFRVIKEARPAFCLCENVPGIIPMELDNVLSDLEGIGYATRTFVIPACAVDARHRRDRVWIVGRFVGDPAGERMEGNGAGGEQESYAHAQPGLSLCASISVADTDEERERRLPIGTKPKNPSIRVSSENLCHSTEQGFQDGAGIQVGTTGGLQPKPERPDSGDWCRWLPEPDVGRVAHGIPSRVDRLKSLGNAIVPQVVYEILWEIRQYC